MNLEFFTLDFKQRTKNVQTQKKKKEPKKKKKPEKRRRRKNLEERKKERKKKIQSKIEDPRHTQILSPSGTSRSSIYSTVHDLHH